MGLLDGRPLTSHFSRLCITTSLVFLVGGVSLASAPVKPSYSAFAAAIRAAGSFHYTWLSQGTDRTIRTVGDASTTEGIQRITFTKGNRTGHLTAIVKANTGYFRGDAFTLTNFLKAPAAVAAKDAGHWLKIGPSMRGFETVASYVRLDSYWLRDFRSVLSATGLPHPVTADGQHVLRLNGTLTHGNATASLMVFLTDSTPPLPVEQKQTAQGRVALDIHFSHWGEALHISIKPLAAARSGDIP